MKQLSIANYVGNGLKPFPTNISIRKYFISFLFLPILFTIFCSQAEIEKLDFTLYDVYGREVRSSDYLGVPVFFEFGACW